MSRARSCFRPSIDYTHDRWPGFDCAESSAWIKWLTRASLLSPPLHPSPLFHTRRPSPPCLAAPWEGTGMGKGLSIELRLAAVGSMCKACVRWEPASSVPRGFRNRESITPELYATPLPTRYVLMDRGKLLLSHRRPTHAESPNTHAKRKRTDKAKNHSVCPGAGRIQVLGNGTEGNFLIWNARWSLLRATSRSDQARFAVRGGCTYHGDDQQVQLPCRRLAEWLPLVSGIGLARSSFSV